MGEPKEDKASDKSVDKSKEVMKSQDDDDESVLPEEV